MKKPRKRVYRIRTNETESDLLQARALAAGMKPTAYIRSQLFPKAAKKIVATKSPDETPAIVATKPKDKKLIKPTVYKSAAETMKDFKPNPKTVKQAEASYRRFAEPGALLKK
jgi:hypothetical protein